MNRLDKILVRKGLAASRTKAAEIIERYGVRVLSKQGEWLVFDKSWQPPSHTVDCEYELLSKELNQYVGRGALKLASAIQRVSLQLEGKNIVDVGQSTGGFTDFCLSQGAKKVLGIEIGFAQLHPRLKKDQRVICWEKTSVFDVQRDQLTSVLDHAVEVVLADVSQVEITALIEQITLWKPSSALILLKPQYQKRILAGYPKGRVHFNDPLLQEKCVQLVLESVQNKPWNLVDFFPSAVCGAEGSQEYWVYLQWNSSS